MLTLALLVRVKQYVGLPQRLGFQGKSGNFVLYEGVKENRNRRNFQKMRENQGNDFQFQVLY